MDRAISPADGYFDRVLKCIPVEVTSVYVALSAATTAFEGATLRWWTFVLFAVGLVAVPAYARIMLDIRSSTQLVMTTVAFLVVVAVTGGWFATLSWWNGYYALLIIVIFGVSTALLEFRPPHPRRTPTQPVPPPATEAEVAPAPRDNPEPAAESSTSPLDEDSALLRVWRGVDPPGSVRP
jgi:hypothetical protein